MPSKLLSKFPPKAKKLWEVAYKNARSRGNSEGDASVVAMKIVKKAYKKQSGVWVRKHLNLKLNLIKHGIFFPSYKFELELSNNKWDNEDQRVSEGLLERFVSSGQISPVGDVDHERWYRKHNSLEERSRLNSDEGTEGLYTLEKYSYDNGSIKAIVSMNKSHKLFNKYLSLHQQGKFLYASAEFPDATIVNGEIVDAKQMLWSITDNPAGDVQKGVMA